jgi:hypothetical protein
MFLPVLSTQDLDCTPLAWLSMTVVIFVATHRSMITNTFSMVAQLMMLNGRICLDQVFYRGSHIYVGLVLESEKRERIRHRLACRISIPHLPRVDATLHEVFTDGACSNQAIPRLRLAASSVFWGPHTPPVSGPLLGPDQSAGRAEIFAVIVATAASYGPLTILSDCLNAVNLAMIIIDVPDADVSALDNNDLWSLFQQVMSVRGCRAVRVLKTKGHAKLGDDPSPRQVFEAWGNHIADRLAVEAIDPDIARDLKDEWLAALVPAVQAQLCITNILHQRNSEGLAIPQQQQQQLSLHSAPSHEEVVAKFATFTNCAGMSLVFDVVPLMRCVDVCDRFSQFPAVEVALVHTFLAQLRWSRTAVTNVGCVTWAELFIDFIAPVQHESFIFPLTDSMSQLTRRFSKLVSLFWALL